MCTRVGSRCQHRLRGTPATSSGGGESLFFPVFSGIWRTVQRRGGWMRGGAAAAGGGRPGPGGRHPRWAACLGTNSSGALGAAGCCWVALPSVSVSSGWPPRPLAAALRVAGVHPACWRPPRGAHPRSCTPAQPALGTGLLGNRRAVRAISAAGASAPDLALCPSLWVAGGKGPPGSRARPESGAPS